MDARNELHAALQNRRDEEEAATQEQEQLDQRRKAYEADEAAVRERLHEVATLTLKALCDSGTAENVPIELEPTGLRRFFRNREHVQGWPVSVPGIVSGALCVDGTLVHRQRFPKEHREPDSNLSEWVDDQVKGVRSVREEKSVKNFFEEAFRPRHSMYSQQEEEKLRSRLSSVQQSVTEVLADLLHQRDISL
jgi:hypothetical protein